MNGIDPRQWREGTHLLFVLLHSLNQKQRECRRDQLGLVQAIEGDGAELAVGRLDADVLNDVDQGREGAQGHAPQELSRKQVDRIPLGALNREGARGYRELDDLARQNQPELVHALRQVLVLEVRLEPVLHGESAHERESDERARDI